MNHLLKEACVETFDEALAAERNGANRIELCSRLDLGGLTPSKALAARILKFLNIPVKVMIRPREGNFYYNKPEIIQMCKDIRDFNSMGVSGVVFGVLKVDGAIDIAAVNLITKVAKNLDFTFHKAIDKTGNIINQLKILIQKTEICAVLSSGGSSNALLGSTVLKNMIKVSNNKVAIICAGSITFKNISKVHTLINGHEYHGRNIIDLSK